MGVVFAVLCAVRSKPFAPGQCGCARSLMCAVVCRAFHQAKHRGGFGARDRPLKLHPGKLEHNTRGTQSNMKCCLVICKAGVGVEAQVLCVSIEDILLYFSGYYRGQTWISLVEKLTSVAESLLPSIFNSTSSKANLAGRAEAALGLLLLADSSEVTQTNPSVAALFLSGSTEMLLQTIHRLTSITVRGKTPL